MGCPLVVRDELFTHLILTYLGWYTVECLVNEQCHAMLLTPKRELKGVPYTTGR